MEFFDSHNHLQLSGSTTLPAGTPSCACASTYEGDWGSVNRIAQENQNIIPGFGIHPWKADTVTLGWELRLETLLKATPHSFVGEAGLDVYRASRPQGLSMEIQRKAVQPQLEIASRLEIPIVLHCVKAWEPLSRFLKDANVRKFAVHRYKGSKEQTKDAIRLGGYLSVHSDSLIHQETADALRHVPIDRILVESDYDGPRPGSLPIAEELHLVLEELSRITGVELALLAQKTAQNARCFYGI